jgi:3-hydroxymyristoyl/3-hydroxydecanoyl-(acyl carrier protein) dehydratase
LSLEYRFAPDHPTGAGHFPGNPIIPGALLLDRILQTVAPGGGRLDVRVAKFLRPVRPGDVVTFRWRETGRDIVFEGVLAGGDVAFTGATAAEAA